MEDQKSDGRIFEAGTGWVPNPESKEEEEDDDDGEVFIKSDVTIFKIVTRISILL